MNLAELYQPSNDGRPPYLLERAEAYVHLNLTRTGLYNEGYIVNSNGVTEVVVPTDRLMSLPNSDFYWLYIGPFAPGIEDVGVCQ